MNHTVKKGDTLAAIAEAYGTTADAIAKANGITGDVKAGATLSIPTGSRPVYSQSADVKSAKATLEAKEKAAPAAYSSAYGKEIKELAEKILSGEKFSYDFNADPVYQATREKAVYDAKRSAEDASANASALSGGYSNSYGAAASAEASSRALASARSVIPSLLEAAYKRWQGERAAEREKLSSVMALDNADYGRYRDSVSDYYADRDYLYGKYSDASDADYQRYLSSLGQWNADRDYDRRVYEYDASAAYKKERDAIEDAYKKERAAAEDAARERQLALEAQKIAVSAARASSGGSGGSGGSGSSSKKSDDDATMFESVDSKTAKQFVYEMNTGRPFDTQGRVNPQFVERVRAAKRDDVISSGEYKLFMDYFRKVGFGENKNYVFYGI